MDVARPELGDDVRLVGDDLELEGVDVGLPLVPVVGVLPRLEMALGHPLLEDEGPGADGRPAEVALLLDDLLRDDRRPPARHAGEERRARLLGVDP